MNCETFKNVFPKTSHKISNYFLIIYKAKLKISKYHHVENLNGLCLLLNYFAEFQWETMESVLSIPSFVVFILSQSQELFFPAVLLPHVLTPATNRAAKFMFLNITPILFPLKKQWLSTVHALSPSLTLLFFPCAAYPYFPFTLLSSKWKCCFWSICFPHLFPFPCLGQWGLPL